MAYFPDLSPCTYFRDVAGVYNMPSVIAVGWLDGKHAFTKGDPGIEVFERLKSFRHYNAWLEAIAFGGHMCELCRYPHTGSAENLFIPAGGITYVAPEGILHYIGAHGYGPPEVFCEAVLKCPNRNTSEYVARLKANGWSAELIEEIETL